jgi:hypothetical protein
MAVKKKVSKARQHCKLKGQRDALPLVASIEREGQGGKPREERQSERQMQNELMSRTQ